MADPQNEGETLGFIDASRAMTRPLTKSEDVGARILEIINNARCDDHRCSKVAGLNEAATPKILQLIEEAGIEGQLLTLRVIERHIEEQIFVSTISTNSLIELLHDYRQTCLSKLKGKANQ